MTLVGNLVSLEVMALSMVEKMARRRHARRTVDDLFMDNFWEEEVKIQVSFLMSLPRSVGFPEPVWCSR